MTLAEYLNQKEHDSTHVLVSNGDEFPHEAYHPYTAVELAVYREYWTQLYYLEQNLHDHIVKETRYLSTRKARRAVA